MPTILLTYANDAQAPLRVAAEAQGVYVLCITPPAYKASKIVERHAR
jgi:hypothetical protein